MLCHRQPFSVIEVMNSHPYCSLVLASDDPLKLAEFYRLAVNGTLLQGLSGNHWIISCSNCMQIQIYKPSKCKDLLIKGNSMHLCLSSNPSFSPLQEIHEWAKDLEKLGARIVEKARNETFGAEIKLLDPEGNYLLLLVPINSDT